jgi:hypothetical protein
LDAVPGSISAHRDPEDEADGLTTLLKRTEQEKLDTMYLQLLQAKREGYIELTIDPPMRVTSFANPEGPGVNYGLFTQRLLDVMTSKRAKPGDILSLYNEQMKLVVMEVVRERLLPSFKLGVDDSMKKASHQAVVNGVIVRVCVCVRTTNRRKSCVA